MKIKVIVHKVGYWAEVPAIPGCATQGETFEELLQKLYEAIKGCLAVAAASRTEDGGGSWVLRVRAISGKDISTSPTQEPERHGTSPMTACCRNTRRYLALRATRAFILTQANEQV